MSPLIDAINTWSGGVTPVVKGDVVNLRDERSLFSDPQDLLRKAGKPTFTSVSAYGTLFIYFYENAELYAIFNDASNSYYAYIEVE